MIKRTRLLPILTVLLLLQLSACQVEDFIPSEVMDSPHIHAISSSNSQIFITVYSANMEEYFSGFNVYMGQDVTEVTNMLYPWTNNTQNPLPTFPTTTKPTAGHRTNIIITLSSDYSWTPFAPGATWYIGVTAYDSQYQNNSPLVDGMVTNVTIN